jgi:hypothetical protein
MYEETVFKLWARYIYSTGQFPNPDYTNTTASWTTRDRSWYRGGTSLPDWKNRIRNHQSATTNFDAVKSTIRWRPGTTVVTRTGTLQPGWLWHAKTQGFYKLGTIDGSIPSYDWGTYKTAYNLAVQRLYDFIRSIESPANAGEDIGEYKQTVNQIRKPMAGLQDLTSYVVNNHVNLLKKAKWNNIKQTAKALGDLTLEYRFGLKPLLSTLAEAKVSLENRDVMFEFYRFNVKGKHDTASFTRSGPYGTGAIRHTYGETIRSLVTVRFKGEYRIGHNVDRRSFNAGIGLTWREAIPTIYNLIPYSFLVDYFTNVGTFMSIFSVPWPNVAWCNKTSRFRHEEIFTELSGEGISQFATTSFTPSSYTYTLKRILRTDQLTIPLPMLEFSLPTAHQYSNIVALLASRLPIIGNLTKKLNRQSGGAFDREFRLATRDRNLRIPYPFHQ